MMTKQSPLQLLFVVYFVAVMVGIFEFFSGGISRTPDIYGDPACDLAAVVSTLYPSSAEAEYLIGRRIEAAASQRFERAHLQRSSDAMNELVSSYREAARHYERASQMGLRSNEGLVYNYALALMRTQADPAKIDLAIAEWRRDFPDSMKRDLDERRRTLTKELERVPSQRNTRRSGF